ncbi:hypothetical protein RRG08_035904 [Elysia crispata]|uniref:Uncharacterized protein n=1 Tax=Elysia crispata TaxID=231223 RepID=A0AAE1A346_9GAST|nr:hypothetical protein RRG08_035904 [Elysia crispata]
MGSRRRQKTMTRLLSGTHDDPELTVVSEYAQTSSANTRTNRSWRGAATVPQGNSLVRRKERVLWWAEGEMWAPVARSEMRISCL